MIIDMDLIEYTLTDHLEVEDKHYPSAKKEWFLDNQDIGDDIWQALLKFIRNQMSIMLSQKTIDKRQTLQSVYQLDGYGPTSVTIFIEENDNCSSIFAPKKWIIVRFVEELEDTLKVIAKRQCDKYYTTGETAHRCQRTIDHEGDCRFAN